MYYTISATSYFIDGVSNCSILFHNNHLASKHKIDVVSENVGWADNNAVAGMKNM